MPGAKEMQRKLDELMHNMLDYLLETKTDDAMGSDEFDDMVENLFKVSRVYTTLFRNNN